MEKTREVIRGNGPTRIIETTRYNDGSSKVVEKSPAENLLDTEHVERVTRDDGHGHRSTRIP